MQIQVMSSYSVAVSVKQFMDRKKEILASLEKEYDERAKNFTGLALKYDIKSRNRLNKLKEFYHKIKDTDDSAKIQEYLYQLEGT